MLRKLSRLKNTLSLLFSIVFFLFSYDTHATQNSSAAGTSNFSFSSYLGTGFYTTSGQDVFVIQLPFDFTIKEKTNTEAGIILNLPLTFGVINFDNIDLDDLPNISDVTTLTFLPGIEYQYPVTSNWTLSPFFDYGFAHDYNNSTNILVTGIGVKSYYHIPVKNAVVTLGNRFLYAREQNKNAGFNSDYTLIETGLNYRVASDYLHDGGSIFNNLYYIIFYYPDSLVFLEQTNNPIRIGIEHEIGITFSNLPSFWLFEKTQLGFGVRRGNGIDVYRIIFGAPF